MKKILLIFTYISILYWSCQSKEETNKKPTETAKDSTGSIISLTPDQSIQAQIITEHPGWGEADQSIQIQGVLELFPTDKASAFSHFDGIVREIIIHEGEDVKQGQILMYIESIELIQLQQQYFNSVQDLYQKEKEKIRQEKLKLTHATSEKEWQEAMIAYEKVLFEQKALASKLHLAQINPEDVSKGKIMKQVPLISPISGHCTAVSAHIGSSIHAGEKVADIHKAQKLHASLQVPESMIHQVKEGQEVTLYITHQNNRQVHTTVHGFSKTMMENQRKSLVFAWVEGKEAEGLLPGMYVTASISNQKEEMLQVPEKAVVMHGDRYFVFVELGLMSSNCKHSLCLEHMDCPLEEDCPEHHDCEKHELCRDKLNCQHTDCKTHEVCLKDQAGEKVPTQFQMKEIFIQSKNNGQVSFIPADEELSDHSKIVVKGAYYVYSVALNKSEAGCCP